jgi:hypothetical protein
MEFGFELVSLYHTVLRLLYNRLVPAILFTDTDSCSDARTCPLGCTPVESKALLDYVMHGSTGFFEGCLIVRSMTEDDINIVKLQALK